MKHHYALSLMTLILCSIGFSSTAQIFEGPDKIKMAQARQSFNEEDYNGALRVYRVLYTDHGTDAKLNYRMAECHLELRQGDLALNYLSKARDNDAEVDADLNYNFARAHRLRGEQKEAISYLDKYLESEKLSKFDMEKAQALKAKCETTLELKANPVDVQISSSGEGVNTDEHHEYHPSVTADGRLMVFTSRRPDTEGGQRYPGDNDWYEDVYISYWSDSLKGWAPAMPIPGSINTEGHDASLSISPDGRQLFIFMNENGGDIFVSKTRMNKQASDAIAAGSPDAARLMSLNRWSRGYTLGKNVNSSYWDSNASLTNDGNTIYFASERPMGSKGNGDIWMSQKISRKNWEKAVNVETINTIEDEKGVFVHPSGDVLFFSSEGHRNMGGYDIFRSYRLEDGTWSEPENLGYPINTPEDEVDFVMTADGKTAYYAKKGSANGKFDIMRIDLSNYDLLKKEPLKKK